MNRRDLARHLAEAAKASMPKAEARKFAALLKGRRAASLPGDGLPPITIDEPKRRQPRSRPECGWYYGEPCRCGRPGAFRGDPHRRPVQLDLFAKAARARR